MFLYYLSDFQPYCILQPIQHRVSFHFALCFYMPDFQPVFKILQNNFKIFFSNLLDYPNMSYKWKFVVHPFMVGIAVDSSLNTLEIIEVFLYGKCLLAILLVRPIAILPYPFSYYKKYVLQ